MDDGSGKVGGGQQQHRSEWGGSGGDKESKGETAATKGRMHIGRHRIQERQHSHGDEERQEMAINRR